MTERYAVYYAPPAACALWQFGCGWLGRDPERDCSLPQPGVPGVNAAQLEAITAAPRLYGFHATLKPPFALAEGASRQALLDAIAGFAARRRRFPMPPLRLGRLSGFLALRAQQEGGLLDALAADCVRELDEFRRPADHAEIARRNEAGLDARQRELLARWGYPYVLDQFRFHLTLTQRLSDADAGLILPWLEAQLAAPLREPLTVDEVCLFVQDAAGAPFRLVRRFRFGADP